MTDNVVIVLKAIQLESNWTACSIPSEIGWWAWKNYIIWSHQFTICIIAGKEYIWPKYCQTPPQMPWVLQYNQYKL